MMHGRKNIKQPIYLIQISVYLVQVSCMLQPYVVIIRLAIRTKINTR